MFLVIGFQTLLLAVCCYSIWRGGAPERLVGILCLVAAAATMIVNIPGDVSSGRLEIGAMAVDLALFLIVAGLAIQANRYWPLWATAALSIAPAVHFIKLAKPDFVWPLYALLTKGSSLAVLLILWAGTIRHQRRLKRRGTDQPWRLT